MQIEKVKFPTEFFDSTFDLPNFEKFTIEKLEGYRKAKRYTKTEMANFLGYKFASGYANIEAGRVTLKFIDAIKIAYKLNLPLSELFFEND